jgi:F0F1-type ATP synthase delta subunit
MVPTVSKQLLGALSLSVSKRVYEMELQERLERLEQRFY